MARLATLELSSNKMSFSAGHFTIFSSTDRETMHGHNYHVVALITAAVNENDITFNYRDYKNKIINLCDEINHYFLLPEGSPYIKFEQDDNYIYAIFNHKKMPFLHEDVRILPIRNITLEGLSHWFLQRLVCEEKPSDQVHEIVIKVTNGPSHSALASWKATATVDIPIATS